MGKKSPGHIEQLPSGSWRVKVYGGTDPLTGREIRLRKTCKTERAALIELGKLLEQAGRDASRDERDRSRAHGPVRRGGRLGPVDPEGARGLHPAGNQACARAPAGPQDPRSPPRPALRAAAPSSHTPAYLGEVVVHTQDIRQPLGLVRTPSVDALTPVADFFARRNFTVASRTHAAGLQLRADDGPFATGAGPLVRGSTLALVMSMAGRVSYLAELDGPGVPTLRSRLQATAA